MLPYQMPINPISANLLPNGKVLIVAGSENDARNNSRRCRELSAAVWDPNGTNESSITVQNLIYDVFCSGTAALFDGRSLIVGGTSDYTFTAKTALRSSIRQRTSMCSLRIWLTGDGMRQQRPLPMAALWPCPALLKLGEQVEPSKFMISKELEPVGIHLLAFSSLHRFTQGLSCCPGEKCFIPDTAVVHRMPMRGSSAQPREPGRNQPPPISTAAMARQFCFLFCRPSTCHA